MKAKHIAQRHSSQNSVHYKTQPRPSDLASTVHERDKGIHRPRIILVFSLHDSLFYKVTLEQTVLDSQGNSCEPHEHYPDVIRS